MYLKLLTGRNAGEIRDVRADQAKLMLADGRAERDPANGGAISAGRNVLVGEHAPETILPAKVAKKLAKAAREGRRG